MANLLENLPRSLPQELVEVLAESSSVRIERIVSSGHRSPEDFWYDQDEHEWVIVLKGAARIVFDDGECVELQPGGFTNIPARRRHRVDWTTPHDPTVWLAVFYRD